MRELKFRAWHISTGTMVFYNKFRGIMNENYPGFNIMQYTGLKDKHGVEIYEGDIVRWGLNFSGTGRDNERWHRYAVVEINPDIQFKILYYIVADTKEKKPSDNYIFNFGIFAYKHTDKYLEIIGNIHQNPDLL